MLPGLAKLCSNLIDTRPLSDHRLQRVQINRYVHPLRHVPPLTCASGRDSTPAPCPKRSGPLSRAMVAAKRRGVASIRRDTENRSLSVSRKAGEHKNRGPGLPRPGLSLVLLTGWYLIDGRRACPCPSAQASPSDPISEPCLWLCLGSRELFRPCASPGPCR